MAGSQKFRAFAKAAIVTIWAYYDESGEYDANGILTNLTVGCCVSTLEKWKVLEDGWKAVLKEHRLDTFHMTKFEAWRPPFDFKLLDGLRDYDRHNRILNALIELMIENIDGMHGYAATSILGVGDNAHREYFEDCIVGAVKGTVLEIWDRYRRPINIVLDRQNHFPLSSVRDYLAFYDFGEASDRIGSCVAGSSTKLIGLQAADILAFEMARCQRKDRPERYPFRRFHEAAEEKRIRMSLAWGPIRSKTEIF